MEEKRESDEQPPAPTPDKAQRKMEALVALRLCCSGKSVVPFYFLKFSGLPGSFLSVPPFPTIPRRGPELVAFVACWCQWPGLFGWRNDAVHY